MKYTLCYRYLLRPNYLHVCTTLYTQHAQQQHQGHSALQTLPLAPLEQTHLFSVRRRLGHDASNIEQQGR